MGSLAVNRPVKGKSAIVTGAGSGINFEFAKILLNNGCNVLIGDVTLRPEAQKLVDSYSNTTDGPKAIYQKTDVSSWKDLHALFRTAEDQFGTYDIVCPGAGIFEPPSSGFWHPPGSEKSKDDPFGDRYKSIDIDLVHPIRATQLAMSHFMSSDPPAGPDNMKIVVHISSIASEMVFAPVPLYVSSKWGLRGFIYTMGELEETRHIRVAGVAPAIVRTPLWLESEKRNMILMEDGTVQSEWVTPVEVAEVMYNICVADEMTNSRGEAVSLKGGSLVEVVQSDVRDVPVYGNQPPGTGGDTRGLMMANVTQAWKDMNDAVGPNWGRV
ncbi:hypothetical protein LTS08_005938 [Lithohypha guttulata]|uniref:uncharacterized protein n=1 Tax=Lithohypha guttulata TaxID=1690604 RepID=UPI002DE04E5F|nr:hypothetical protein LTR51_002452 [Lithohypha guttulata]KAK5099356.1 hypothetical protein LTS08_005938 [Lithohypha guttulata]